ncbi:MAG: 50S ribosomal protein L25 [Patescibacteria group bacterium]|nr:50S ribosomal protein L25 [Patescibacteria group bacterium]
MTQNTQNKIVLEVSPRNVFGKKLKKIRKMGLVPANIYGVDFKSTAINVNFKDFIKVYKKAKETGIVYLKLEKQEIPTLINNIQKHPVSNNFLHIDFRKINLTEKIETEVPIKIIGKSEAVETKGGVLLTLADKLTIEALPEKIPSFIEIDISSLKEIDQEIKVKDLKKDFNYFIKDDLEKTIISIVAHKEETITPQTTPVTPTEPVAEGEKPAEEQKKDQSSSSPSPKEKK